MAELNDILASGDVNKVVVNETPPTDDSELARKDYIDNVIAIIRAESEIANAFYFEVLSDSLVISEGDGDVTAISLDAGNIPQGDYRVEVSLVVGFTTRSDQLGLRFTGTLPSPDFLLEAKGDDEKIPLSYAFPYTHPGNDPMLLNLIVWIEGVGQADATILAANIMVQKVNGLN